MVKKVLSYALIPIIVFMLVFGIHLVTFQARAFTPPTLPTTIPTDFPTLKPITADISGDFTDANFKKAVWKWLGNSGDPGAFSRLDIQNKIDAGTTVLNVSSRDISSLNGLEYFDGLTYLSCTYNKLTSLPALPATLETLYCHSNQLASLPDLPSVLSFLDCSSNNLTVLPAISANMKRLNCNYNKLTEISTLPNGLITLSCIGNKIRTINIPSTLTTLLCSENMLTSLPTLPGTLEALLCAYNQLTRLPTVPASLKNIDVRENCLSELPALPATVTQFKVEYNYLDVFGTSLGNALNKPNYTYKPQYRIQYTDGTLEVEMGKTVTFEDIKKQMSADSNVWGDVSDVPLSDLTFTSNNNSVAKVDSAGVITGVSIGTTHINAFFRGIDSKLTKTSAFVKVIAPTLTPEPPTESGPPIEPSSQYGETSTYAIPFMDQAVDLGIMTDRLRGKSMVVATTRQEFAELAVKFYEKVTGTTAPIPAGKTFTDCNNPEVLKAYGLKITYGAGDETKFEPNNKLSRQQMAAMIERTLKACYPNIVIDTLGQPDFKDQKDFASYSILPAKFMAKYEITVGDGQGHFNPNDDCLRQQTFIFLVKAYNFRDKYIYE